MHDFLGFASMRCVLQTRTEHRNTIQRDEDALVTCMASYTLCANKRPGVLIHMCGHFAKTRQHFVEIVCVYNALVCAVAGWQAAG